MSTPSRKHVPGATFPLEAHALADAILAAGHVAAVNDALKVGHCDLDEKHHKLCNCITRNSGALLTALRALRELRPVTRKPRPGPVSGPPASLQARDGPSAA